MKKLSLILFACLASLAISCVEPAPVTVNVPMQLVSDGQPVAADGILITLSSGDVSFEATTDPKGLVTFIVPVGIYNASTSFKLSKDGILYNYNGNTSVSVAMPAEGTALETVQLDLKASKSSQLIIKECYNGGCMDNAGSKNYQYDKYLIVYNNSDTEVDATKMCVAMAQITPMSSTNKYTFDANGVIEYETAGWTPASYGIWWFQDGTQVKIAPYSQIVIAINGAVDHTATYSKSVDLSKADYCMYDLESGFNLAAAYPAPVESIDPSRYMKTIEYAQGTAWPFPMQTAAPFIMIPTEDIKAFVKEPTNFDNRSTNLSGNFAKVPTSWVLDAIDIWANDNTSKNFSRFPSTVNTGFVVFTTNKAGYSIYRNVDKAATEAIADNAGKLVYNYDGAVDNDADGDPSGIDAEASIANGAKIVYMDTNNSANDFHVRKVASIKK